MTGCGCIGGRALDIVVTIPNGSVYTGDGTATPAFDSVTADSLGDFTYLFQKAADAAEIYTVEVFDSADIGHTTVLATTEFDDGSVFSISLKYKDFGFDAVEVKITLIDETSKEHLSPPGGDDDHGHITVAVDSQFTGAFVTPPIDMRQ